MDKKNSHSKSENLMLVNRVANTRKDVEELKHQLDNLISKGLKFTEEHQKLLNSSIGNKENISHSDNKVQIIKSYDNKNVIQQNPAGASKLSKTITSKNINNLGAIEEQNQQTGSAKKVRSYNVDETREYMKKQKEKRLAQLKSQSKKSTTAIDIKKQKLNELHKKSVELVTKNVKAKRERSQSRERYDRNKAGSVLQRERSASHAGRNTNRDKSPAHTHTRPMSIERRTLRKSNITEIKKDPNFLCPPDTDETSHSRAGYYNLELGRANPSSQREKIISHDNKTKKRTKSLECCGSVNPNLHPALQEEQHHSPTISKVDSSNNILPKNKCKLNRTELQSIKIHSTGDSISNSGELIRNESNEIPVTSNPTITRNELQKNKEFVNLNESTSPKNLLKETKETQTVQEQKQHYPEWLQEKPIQAYPYNFINTVKRKLQSVLNTPKSTTDVGVQNSFTNLQVEGVKLNSPETVIKNKDDLKAMLQKSAKSSKHADYQSYGSHKCVNLDPKALEHLELVTNKPPQKTKLDDNKYLNIDSESDTSKNIPDISSESVTSLKAKSISASHGTKKSNSYKALDQFLINTDKIEKMKLTAHGNRSDCEENVFKHPGVPYKTIKTNKNFLPTSNLFNIESSKYDSDFNSESHSESGIDAHSSSLEDRQKSIITQNSCKYSSPKLTSNYVINNKQSVTSNIPEKISTNNSIPESIKSKKSATTCNSQESLESERHSFKEASSIVGTEHSNKSSEKSSSSMPVQTVTTLSSKNSHKAKISSQHSFISKTLPTGMSNTTPKSLSTIDAHQKIENTIPPLREPTAFLQIGNRIEKLEKNKNSETNVNEKDKENMYRSICLRQPFVSDVPTENLNNSNQIHLKFEAEIHLLNDFNESLRQFSAVEKAFENLKFKNSDIAPTKILENRNTQTSIASKTGSHVSALKHSQCSKSLSVPEISEIQQVSSGINYSRGTDVNMEDISLLSNNFDNFDIQDGSIFKDLEAVNLNEPSINEESKFEVSTCDAYNINNSAGLSLKMFEQLIKDEDVRFENLRTILKIREQALLDRTKGELACLEIEKKHLRETGKRKELAVMLRKKQRGILMKLQQEQHEMKRLKQMQKAASLERKTLLREQRNLIKAQLSTDNMLSRIKVSSQKERRQSGPLRVVQSQNESVRSETSISRRSSLGEEVVSIISHTHSVRSRLSEEILPKDVAQQQLEVPAINEETVSNLKRALLMRQTALQKRKKEAEDLLKWHQKLIEEEKRIAELEAVANTIITQPSNASTIAAKGDVTESFKFKGKQLNQLWLNVTGDDRKKLDDKSHSTSGISQQRNCKEPKYSTLNKTTLTSIKSDVNSSSAETKTDNDSISELSENKSQVNIPNNQNNFSDSVRTEFITNSASQGQKTTLNGVENENIRTVNDYTSDFDIESGQEINEILEIDEVDQKRLSSITQLIDNFSKIREEISSISQQSRKSLSSEELSTTKDISSIKSGKLKLPSEKVSLSKSKSLQNEDNLASKQVAVESKAVSKDTTSVITEKPFKAEGEPISNGEDVTSKKSTEIPENITKSVSNAIDVSKSISPEKELSSIKPKHSSEATEESSKETISRQTPEGLKISNESVEIMERILSNLSGSKISSEVPDLPDVYGTEKNLEIISQINESLNEMREDLIDAEITETVNKSLSKLTEQHTPKDDVQSLIDSKEKDASISAEEDKQELSVLKEVDDENCLVSNIEEESMKETDIDEELSLDEEPCQIESEKSNGYLKEVQDIDEEQHLSIPDIQDKTNENSDVQKVETEVICSKSKSASLEEQIPKGDSRITDHDTSKVSTDLSYGILENRKSNENSTVSTNKKVVSNSEIASELHSKEVREDVDRTETEKSSLAPPKELYSLEEKEQDSLSPSSSSEKLLAPNKDETVAESEEVSGGLDVVTAKSKSEITTESEKISSKGSQIDVKKRVSEILADASPRGDKSPRVQDLYITTYDVVSPTGSPELGSPVKDENKQILSVKTFYGDEAEELLKKQLAIEQEIKQLEQQQKEQVNYMFVREIPNKPPPPYTPPTSQPPSTVTTIIPNNCNEIDEISKYSAKIIHKAYLSNNLENINISENTLNLITKENIDKDCYKFVFDLCKDLSLKHYKQFQEEIGPSWLTALKKSHLTVKKPLNAFELERYLNKSLRELFGFQKSEIRENAIIKWSRKKRDHVDEILVLESQAEESEWISYDKDELFVMNEVTNDIMKMLLNDTTDVIRKILAKQTYFY